MQSAERRVPSDFLCSRVGREPATGLERGYSVSLAWPKTDIEATRYPKQAFVVRAALPHEFRMLIEQRTQPLEIAVLDRAIGEHEGRPAATFIGHARTTEYQAVSRSG